MQTVADNINILGTWCGQRDVEELTAGSLEKKYGIRQADVMVLFGGSILCGGDVMAQAMINKAARHFVIVGGAGHTTPALRGIMGREFPDLDTADLQEADLFDEYLRRRYSLSADLLETASTNCGNNITFLLDLLGREGISWHHIILAQDATMQRRMDAGMRKYRPDGRIINFAAYRATAIERGGHLAFSSAIRGMWEMERYISLLLGEIPRLRDNDSGYGPNGKDFIAHVDIPPEVEEAFSALKSRYKGLVRAADPAFADAAFRPGEQKSLQPEGSS